MRPFGGVAWVMPQMQLRAGMAQGAGGRCAEDDGWRGHAGIFGTRAGCRAALSMTRDKASTPAVMAVRSKAVRPKRSPEMLTFNEYEESAGMSRPCWPNAELRQ